MRLAFDIETDGLLDELTTIHSIVAVDVKTGRGWSATDHPGYTSPNGYEVISIDECLRLLLEAEEIVGHNIIAFDIPAIQKVKPWFMPRREQVRDTLIDSRLIWPEIRENHFAFRNKRQVKVNRRADQVLKEREQSNEEMVAAYEAETEDFNSRYDEWKKAAKSNGMKLKDYAVVASPPIKPEKPDLLETDHKKIAKEIWDTAYFPGRLIGSHSLEAWGWVLGEWKGDYSSDMKAKGLDPWSEWNVPMQEYCEQDVTVTLKLLATIEKKLYSPYAREIERNFAWIIAEMERNGFPFDMELGLKTQRKLMKRRAELMDQIKSAFKPITETWDYTPKANNAKLGYVKGETITRTKEIEFNPSSRQHIAKWLKKMYGWKPEEYTENGQAKVDESVLKKLPYPEAKALSEIFLIDKRLGMLEGRGGKGLIPFAKKGNGKIHGRVLTCAAVTRRCTHSSPNMAQLPAVNVPYGTEFRSMMTALPGYVLLGWDASGLELRCFAHYMARYDGGTYTKTVLEGDIHWVHSKALGLVPEDAEYDDHDEHHNWARNKVAKRFIYAFLYGAGPVMIGEIVCPEGSEAQKRREGNRLIKTFLARTPAIAKLKKALDATVKARGGHIMGIDGGLLKVRHAHASLNTLLQSAGAIAVKLATILYYDKLIAQGLVSGEDFMLVAHVHDEVQTIVKKGLEDVVGRTAVEAMREAGEALGFKCPLDGDYKFGANWAETH